MSYPVITRHGGTLNAYYRVKEANLKRRVILNDSNDMKYASGKCKTIEAGKNFIVARG